MKTEVQIDVQDLDHLGIIAGIVDEIGIVEIINEEIRQSRRYTNGTDEREKVSAGQVVKGEHNTFALSIYTYNILSLLPSARMTYWHSISDNFVPNVDSFLCLALLPIFLLACH